MEAVSDKFEMAYSYLHVVMQSAPEPASKWFAATDGNLADRMIEAVRQLSIYCQLPQKLADIESPSIV